MRQRQKQKKQEKKKRFDFTSAELKRELHRLCNLFLPEFSIPKLDISVGERIYTKAAITYYTLNKIVMFKPYHDKFPADYKVTLLHEFGHLIADYSHGVNFKRYFNLLKSRQRRIGERVIPDAYSDFLFSKVSRHYTKRYFCPICRTEKVYRKKMSMVCKPCQIPMLEDMCFEGLEAIIPPEMRATVNRSVNGLRQFTSYDVIR